MNRYYYEMGDVISMDVDMEVGDVYYFKNPKIIRGRISTGDFVMQISTPFTESGLREVVEILKGGVDAS